MNIITNGSNPNGHIKIGQGGVFGNSYHVWRRLQHGQEEIIRWGRWREVLPGKLRHQNGHEHCCSVGFLFNYYLYLIRPHVGLDEPLIMRCIAMHDIPEGIRGIDTPAPDKRDENDRDEYLVFEELFSPLGEDVWREMQRCFLLQFCLSNPVCFPEDARRVMAQLARTHRKEAIFFDGAQKLDYLYYAYECFVEREIPDLLRELVPNHSVALDRIAAELPGFGEVIWTPQVRNFFSQFSKQVLLELS